MEVRFQSKTWSCRISTATLVWYNGMDEWKYASEIDELKPFHARSSDYQTNWKSRGNEWNNT
jgi:hypothetical protein